MLFGPVAHVHAELDRRRPGARADDDAFVALTHASGVRSHLWMSALAGDHALRMRVLGSRAAYVKRGMDVQESALRAGRRLGHRFGVRLRVGGAWDGVETERGAYPEFYARVAAALREGSPPPVDPMDAVAGLEIIHAAQVSAAEKRVVRLD